MLQTLINYTLYLADNALILAQRNAEWCGHGPILEQDIALTNISLDLLGQSRSFYQYAAQLINAEHPSAMPATEDSLAYLRDVFAFRNILMNELPNGDWGQTVLRQFFFSAYQFPLFERMKHSSDATLAAIAEKSLKEVTYHLRWSSEWVIRLGDGTEESHSRMEKALDELWTYTGEIFEPAPYEKAAVEAGFGVDATSLKDAWMERVSNILQEATLTVPAPRWMQTGGKEGKHSEHLGFVLAEMQFLQRAYPNATW
ncbi:MAG: phenylacetate-CoA oxygenase subunit PaaC [Chitinophagaceae bacterium]|nr:phenylacetate-CoA oxygenase subunit PaaC [Chitinophagaceae bacterium]